MEIGSWARRLAGFRGGGVSGGASHRSGGGRVASLDPRQDHAERILAEIEAAELVGGDPYGVHEVVKKLDLWFGIEVGRLERDAQRDAVEWARAGLPRPGIEDDALPVESRLAARAAEIYRKWARLLLTKVQDGITGATRRAGHAIVQYGERLAALRRTHAEIEATRAEVAAALAHAEREPHHFASTSHLALWKFWVLISLLIAVDWVANVPVFQELLPQEAGADELWATIVAQSESRGALGGLYRVWMRILFTPDVSILALGVIAFLVFLAHISGESARHLIALGRLERHEVMLAGRGGGESRDGGGSAGGRGSKRFSRGRRRLYLIPLLGGLAGAVAVVAVLYMARERIKAESDARLAEAAEEVRALEGRLVAANEAGDLEEIGEVTGLIRRAQEQLEDRRARAQYASGIQAMNLPITGLNLVLVIASALASFLAADVARTEGRLAVPRIDRLEARLKELAGEEARHRAELRGLVELIQSELTLADRLLHARPLEGAEEKARRLESVIDLFRAENARERGIDPATILAFRKRVELDLPPTGTADQLETPPELVRYQEEFRQLRERHVGLGDAEREMA